jgi:hypothetical protein
MVSAAKRISDPSFMMKKMRNNVVVAVNRLFSKPSRLLALYNKSSFPCDIASLKNTIKATNTVYFKRFLNLKTDAKEIFFKMAAKEAGVDSLNEFERRSVWKEVGPLLKIRIETTHTAMMFPENTPLSKRMLDLAIKKIKLPPSDVLLELIRAEVFDAEVHPEG